MIDNTTYLLTQHNSAGPIIRPAEPMPHEIYVDDDSTASLTRDRVIGGVISLGLLAATGVYLFLSF